MKKIRQSIRLKFTMMYIFILAVSCFSALIALIAIYMALYQFNIPHDHTDGVWITLLSLLVCAIVGTILMFVVTRKISGPITNLSEKTKAVAKGNFDVKMPVKSIDEIGILAENFNLMTEALRVNELLRKDFISSVSHEFKTPLAAIQGFVEVIKSPELSREEFEEYTDIILDETRRLSGLVTNMLRLSKLDHQRILSEGKTFAADEQIRKSLVLLEEKWSAKNLSLDLVLDYVPYCAEEELLSQIWVNLIENAIKYSNPEGCIYIGLKKESEEMVFTVRDEGIGISEKNLPQIFDQFYQADHSRGGEGSGLGLSIVKRIVELHRGQITVRSVVNEGTEFTVKLPLNP